MASWAEKTRREMASRAEQIEARGRQQGEAALLARQIMQRFGPLSQSVQRRISGADADQLLEWGECFVTASSIEEIFDGKL